MKDRRTLDRIALISDVHGNLTALEAVPPDCRALWDSILKGMSYKEIGESMGLSEGTLRVRAHRCRKRAVEALGGNARPLRLANEG